MTTDEALRLIHSDDPIMSHDDLEQAAKALAIALHRERDEHVSDAARIEMLREENARQREEIERMREMVEAAAQGEIEVVRDHFGWRVFDGKHSAELYHSPMAAIEAAFKQWKEGR